MSLLIVPARTKLRWVLRDIRGAGHLADHPAAPLAGFEIVSDSEFVVELEKPLPIFPVILTGRPASILPSGIEELPASWRQGAVGTGPFRIAASSTETRIELERNPHYWRRGLPRSEGLVFRYGLTPTAIGELFRAGELALCGELDPGEVDTLRADPGLGAGYREAPALSTYFIAANRYRGPLMDPVLRERLFGSIDVARLVRRTLHHVGIPASGLIPPGLLGALSIQTSSADQTGSDRAGEGRSTHGEPIHLTAALHPIYRSEYANLLEALCEELRLSGFVIQPLNDDFEGYAELRGKGATDLVIARWEADHPDADTFVHGVLHSADGFMGNYCGSEELDRLAERGRLESDRDIRHALYREAEAQIAREHLLLPLFHRQIYRFARPEVAGLELGFCTPAVAYERLSLRC